MHDINIWHHVAERTEEMFYFIYVVALL